jgi:hypothetical protein
MQTNQFGLPSERLEIILVAAGRVRHQVHEDRGQPDHFPFL